VLLRRVIEHVKDQNWFAIAIDFVIVVTGVFVGIQVSNWNNERRDEMRADAYVERIANDLLTDEKNIRMRQSFWRQVIEEGEAALSYSDTGVLKDGSAWRSALAFYQASQIFPYVHTETTYSELKSAGQLGLIRDADLRAKLAEYYTAGSAEQAGYLTRLIPAYRDTIRGKTPVAMARHIWRECITTDGLDWQMLQECDSPFDEEQAYAVLKGYVEPVVLEQLRSWIGNQEISLILLQHNLSAAERMIEQIAALRH
jgi:hypothetical protein